MIKRFIIILALSFSSFLAYSQSSSWQKTDTILVKACFSDSAGVTITTVKDDVYGLNFWDQVIEKKRGEINSVFELHSLMWDYDFLPIYTEHKGKEFVCMYRKVRKESETRYYGENVK